MLTANGARLPPVRRARRSGPVGPGLTWPTGSLVVLPTSLSPELTPHFALLCFFSLSGDAPTDHAVLAQ